MSWHKGSVDVFLGTDTQGNPIEDAYMFSGDSRYTAKSEDIARRFDWNMMNYQNWWNSPELQVSRLEDAGLNPLFYLGGNAGTTPAASGGTLQGQQMSSRNGSIENLLQAVNTANAALGTGAQMRLIANNYEVQTELNDIAAYNAVTQRKLVDAQVPRILAEEDYYNYYLMPKTQRETALIDELIQVLQKDLKIKDELVNLIQALTKQLQALEAYYYSLVRLNYTQELVNHALVKYYGSTSAYYDAIGAPMAQELESRAGFNKENARKISHEATKALFEGNIMQFLSYLLNKYGESKYIAEITNIWSDTANKGTQSLLNALDFGVGVGTGGASRILPGMRQNPSSMQGVFGSGTGSVRNPIGFGN